MLCVIPWHFLLQLGNASLIFSVESKSLRPPDMVNMKGLLPVSLLGKHLEERYFIPSHDGALLCIFIPMVPSLALRWSSWQGWFLCSHHHPNLYMELREVDPTTPSFTACKFICKADSSSQNPSHKMPHLALFLAVNGR